MHTIADCMNGRYGWASGYRAISTKYVCAFSSAKHCATISTEAIPLASVSGESCRNAPQSCRRNAPLLVSASARELRQYWAKARVSVCMMVSLRVSIYIDRESKCKIGLSIRYRRIGYLNI